MKRFPAFDPPEYVDWQPDPDLVRQFAETWARDSDRKAVVESLSHEQRLDLYRGMVRTRLHDVMLKRWVKQGVISKAWLGTGEEATTVGPVHALDRGIDVVAPMIRNAGACCEMGMSVADMLRGYLGTADSPSAGRDGHVGSLSQRVLQPISNIGNIPSGKASNEIRPGPAYLWTDVWLQLVRLMMERVATHEWATEHSAPRQVINSAWDAIAAPAEVSQPSPQASPAGLPLGR